MKEVQVITDKEKEKAELIEYNLQVKSSLIPQNVGNLDDLDVIIINVIIQ